MGHYKSNLRDIEFNLFEVLRPRRSVLGTGPVRRDRRGHRAQHPRPRSSGWPTNELAESLLDVRPQPAGLRPGDPHRDDAGVLQEVATRPTWTPSGGAWTCPRSSAAPSSRRRLRWAVAELVLGSNPAVHMYASGPAFAARRLPARHRGAEARSPQRMVDGQLGRHDGAHRAGRRLRRRRRPHQGRSSRRTAPGTSRASSASSPRPSTTCPRTSSTSCWPAPRAPARAPRACRCSSCPKFHFDWETGELGERNGVYATNVEHKMGLKASTTCELTFGERRARRRLAGRRGARRHRARCSRSSSSPG